MLRAEFGQRVPTGIEENEDGTDVVPIGDGEEAVEALLEAGGVLLPEQVVQEDAHRAHSQAFRPAQFLVDLSGIEGIRLPHFELIDRVGGDEIAADQPGLLLIPRLRLLLGPARFLREKRRPQQNRKNAPSQPKNRTLQSVSFARCRS